MASVQEHDRASDRTAGRRKSPRQSASAAETAWLASDKSAWAKTAWRSAPTVAVVSGWGRPSRR